MASTLSTTLAVHHPQTHPPPTTTTNPPHHHHHHNNISTSPNNNNNNTSTNPHQQKKQTTTPTTKATIDAHFAAVAHTTSASLPPASTASANHARNTNLKRQLIPLFANQFGMSDAQALQAVEMEMGSRYQSNPWDAPALAPAGGLKSMRMGRREEEEKEWGWEVGMGKERREQGYSQSEWDDFEHFLGYR